MRLKLIENTKVLINSHDVHEYLDTTRPRAGNVKKT